MFGSIGGPEILLIFILALLLFGPRKLPEIGRALGKTVAEFRRATAEFRSTLEREVEMEKLKETQGALKSAGSETVDAVRGPGLLGELAAAFRPEPLSRPYGAEPARATGGEPPALPPQPLPTAADGVPAAPVPFSDDAETADRPGAQPPATTEDAAKREEP